jgi:hypothetical protein
VVWPRLTTPPARHWVSPCAPRPDRP